MRREGGVGIIPPPPPLSHPVSMATGIIPAFLASIWILFQPFFLPGCSRLPPGWGHGTCGRWETGIVPFPTPRHGAEFPRPPIPAGIYPWKCRRGAGMRRFRDEGWISRSRRDFPALIPGFSGVFVRYPSGMGRSRMWISGLGVSKRIQPFQGDPEPEAAPRLSRFPGSSSRAPDSGAIPQIHLGIPMRRRSSESRGIQRRESRS